MEKEKCTVCRRVGEKLFIKGDKCLSSKCLVIRKPYAPGVKRRRGRAPSEFSKELTEKQKLKNWYQLRERQFKNYVEWALEKRGIAENTADLLIKRLESRLDNVVFRLGFGVNRAQSRQLVNHGHFLVNGKKIDIPSYSVKKGDVITLRPSSSKKAFFQNISQTIKKHNAPKWLKLDENKLEGVIVGDPSLEEASPPAEISAIFEFYSR